MNVNTLVAKLISGGFEIRDASDIVSWMAGKYGYETVDGLALLEEMYKDRLDGSLTERIRSYVETTQGYFPGVEIDKELRLSPKEKDQRRVILARLVEDKVLQRHISKNGVFRRIEQDSPVIEWEKADVANVFKMNWPFELENYALMYPKNLAVLAGESNAGKTAFLLNVVKLNMADHKIHYYSSEMGAEEMKLRLSKFEDVDKWTFDARERSSNFADIIYPDDINIVDYLEFASSEFYRVAEELRGMFDRLKQGIAIIALQKKKGAELGRGGDFSLEKPRLYLSMGHGILKIVKAKNWSVEGQNPNGEEFHFKLINGAKFVTGSEF